MIGIVAGSFDPQQLQLVNPTAVTWTNRDSVRHEIAADRAEFTSGELEPGETFTFTPTESLKYGCRIHPEMRGVILVENAAQPNHGRVIPLLKVQPPAAGDRVVTTYAVRSPVPGFVAVFAADGANRGPGSMLGFAPVAASIGAEDAMPRFELVREVLEEEVIWFGLFVDDGDGTFEGPEFDVAQTGDLGNAERGQEMVFAMTVAGEPPARSASGGADPSFRGEEGNDSPAPASGDAQAESADGPGTWLRYALAGAAAVVTLLVLTWWRMRAKGD